VQFGEVLCDALFLFLSLLLVNAFFGIWPNDAYAFLPVLLLIQCALTLGLMLILSFSSVLVKDVSQFVAVFLRLLFFLTPILYPLSVIPQSVRRALQLNPMASLVEGYRVIILSGHTPGLAGIVYSSLFSFGILYAGYILFKSHEYSVVDVN
jgi:lipopolysaccharide transport system permease protein